MGSNNKAVLVIGGGIAGIQASLDLANMGFQVYLVEKSPSIGGRMAQLDKTFPTNDCAMCILAPKMIEASRHSNIKLLSYSEVEGLDGEVGNFKAKIRKKARYIDESKCTGCGQCTEICPTKVPAEFELGLTTRKAIYKPFAQAVPNIAVIDPENCRHLKGLREGKTDVCLLCQKGIEKKGIPGCEAGAINFDQTDEIIELEVGAVILATGLDLYDVSQIKEYGYGTIKNVVTALEYERLTSASGPTAGELKRASDGAIPTNIAFIQCVGSRDFRYRPYCSAVCCMHATKEAILASEHHPETHSTIFYMDLRAVGKRFQEYVERAKQEYNAAYIRGRPGKIEENKENQNPIVWYEDTTTGEIKSMEVELVILCQCLVPSKGIKELAEVLRIELDEYDFVKIPDKLYRPLDSTRPGVFACGFVHTPRDIPDSVIQASGAAGRAAEAIESSELVKV
jgi:heterodisulfide reductase subunit A